MPENVGDSVVDESRDEETCFNDLEQDFVNSFELDSAEVQIAGSEAENMVNDSRSDTLPLVPVGSGQGTNMSVNNFVPNERDLVGSHVLAEGQDATRTSATGYSNRPKRASSKRMKPLDDQFLYY